MSTSPVTQSSVLVDPLTLRAGDRVNLGGTRSNAEVTSTPSEWGTGSVSVLVRGASGKESQAFFKDGAQAQLVSRAV